MVLPRLLTKREIDIKRAQERHKELEEGEKLARSVDALRELRVSEEKTFQDWRSSILASLQKEIGDTSDVLSGLKKEVRKFEERRKKAKESLASEWGSLREAEAQIQEAISQLTESKNSLELAIKENLDREHQIAVESERIENDRKRTAEALVSAQTALKLAREDSATVRNKAQTKMVEAEIRLEEAMEKEINVKTREEEMYNRAIKIEKYEEDLMSRELSLRDGWRTLQETMKELNL